MKLDKKFWVGLGTAVVVAVLTFAVQYFKIDIPIVAKVIGIITGGVGVGVAGLSLAGK